MKNFAQPGNAGRFGKIPSPKLMRSKFDVSIMHKTTFDSGYLVPAALWECLPGDTFEVNATLFARLLTLVNPIMDNLYLDTFYFFVPNRIVWENWEKMNGAQDDPGDSTDYTVPVLIGDNLSFTVGDRASYFNCPIGGYGTYPSDDEPMALPFRMYNLIWNEWFRDQDLQNSVPVPKGDGPDDYITLGYNHLLRRGLRHDYITSSRPWPQKGDSVELPLGTEAPVIGTGDALGMNNGESDVALSFRRDTTSEWLQGTVNAAVGMMGEPVGTPYTWVPNGSSNFKALGVTTNPNNSGLIADLSAATAATINQLRQAFAYQTILEMDARGGTRYTEIIRQFFGIAPRDSRLQRPEYLGGSSQMINISVVPQTSATESGSPQGQLAGFGEVVSKSRFIKTIEEHGFIMALINVRADLTWQQKLHRMWTRRTRFDFYLPPLAHLGEQAVLRREVFFQENAPTTNQQVFGYNERWSEYRTGDRWVTGQFASISPTSLDNWHLARYVNATPVLNGTFIEDVPPVDRVVAVQDEPQFYADMEFRAFATRVMPAYSVPAMLGGRF